MSKVTTMAEAAATVEDGGHVALGGFAITRCAVAAVHELIRAGRRDLTLSQCVGGIDTDLLVGAGCVSRLVYSGGSLDRFGPLHAVNRAVLAGTIRADEYSSLALALRLHAGALGLPFLASRTLLGSDLLEPLLASGEVRADVDPFTGDPVVVLAPLRPDVAFVHVDTADEHGNATIGGATWTIRDTALAADTVVVICEELVRPGEITPDRVAIPGAAVDAVVPVRRGAHPTAVAGRYDYDREHLEEYVERNRDGPPGEAGEQHGAAGFQAYLDDYVLGVADHEQYLARAATP